MADQDKKTIEGGPATVVTSPSMVATIPHEQPRPVSLSDYLYQASLTRSYERGLDKKVPAGATKLSTVLSRVRRPRRSENSASPDTGGEISKTGTEEVVVPQDTAASTNPADTANHEKATPGSEWQQASRAARTATWAAVFYLITTDIIAPFSTPWAFSVLGYGPGVALYLVFAVMACYSGWLLHQQFLSLDSHRYPVRNYGDLAQRIFGKWFRTVVEILQSAQFFLNVVLITVGNGQGISQLSQGMGRGRAKICFTVAMFIFTITGLVVGQIRALQRFSYLANLATWMNIFLLLLTMIILSRSEPNYEAAWTSYGIPKGTKVTFAGTPPSSTFEDNINGLMHAVYSYGGAALFCELMAEMRRPFDFWKALILADVVIFSCYLVFALVVYSYQGQFAFNPAYQGIAIYAWQTVANVFALVIGLIAACLYGNIGIKVIHAAVFRHWSGVDVAKSSGKDNSKERFSGIFLQTRLLWGGSILAYWGLAFVVAAAVPQISYLGSFVSATCLMQFSYTFPPAMAIGLNCLQEFEVASGVERRGLQQWRAAFQKKLLINSFLLFYTLGSATTAILGIYSSIYKMHKAYENARVTAFSCDSPTG